MKSKLLCTLSVLALVLASASFALADTCSGTTSTDTSGQAVCDMSPSGSTATINGGQFYVNVGAPTGTGVFDPFLRVQENGAEGGWNEDYTNTPDVPTGTDSKVGTWTHSLTVSQLATVTYNDVLSYEFTLDIQQANPTLESLNSIQIFVGSNADPSDSPSNCTGANFATCIPGAGDTLAWSMDAGSGGDSSVTLDSSIHQGQGTSNMTLYVPVADFNNLDGNLIFYTQFGNPPGQYDSNSAFEEWNALEGTNTAVPEPGSLALFGTGLLSMAGFLRRKLSA